jgi:hypothetical protein
MGLDRGRHNNASELWPPERNRTWSRDGCKGRPSVRIQQEHILWVNRHQGGAQTSCSDDVPPVAGANLCHIEAGVSRVK